MGSDTAPLSVDRWAVAVRVRLRAIISMLRLRRLAIVLIAIGLITSAIYATGAFSNLSASRDANVRVAGDASGYLALQPSDGPNGAYATQQNGQLRVSLTEVATANGEGVNPNAITRVQSVFTITNQGTQPVEVWLMTTATPSPSNEERRERHSKAKDRLSRSSRARRSR